MAIRFAIATPNNDKISAKLQCFLKKKSTVDYLNLPQTGRFQCQCERPVSYCSLSPGALLVGSGVPQAHIPYNKIHEYKIHDSFTFRRVRIVHQSAY